MSVLCPVAVPWDVRNETQPETATDAFLSFLNKKRLCDVKFVFNHAHETIEAHQFCLRARSPVFDSMFRGFGSTTSMTEVKVEDASPELFDKFLQFIYADKLDVTPVQALHLLHLGHKYNVQPLVKKCEALISIGISTENAIELYETAEKYQLLSLKTKAGDVIARSLEHLLKSPKLLRAKETTLVALLKRSDLTVKETDLFQLALKWGREKSSGDHELSVALAEVLPNIRFTKMTPKEFTTVVWPTKLIPPEDAVNIFAFFNGDESTRKAISPLLKFSTSNRAVRVEFEVKVEKIISFGSGYKFKDSWSLNLKTGCPYKECMSFRATVSGSCEKGRSFNIQSVSVKWPARRVVATSSLSTLLENEQLNFRVLVMRKPSSQELYTTKFDTIVYDCRRGRTAHEVLVQPPEKIENGFDYCIAVLDEHPQRTERIFDYGPVEKAESERDQQEFIANPNFKLDIRDVKRNSCPKTFEVSAHTGVHVIRNICVVVEL